MTPQEKQKQSKACEKISELQLDRPLSLSKALLRKGSAITLLSLFLISGVQAQSTEKLKASDIDWINLEDLSEAQQKSISEQCCGRYIEPEFPKLEGDLNRTDLSATKNLFYSNKPNNNIVILEDDVEVIRLNELIKADYGLYNKTTSILDLNGNIRIRQPGMLLVGTDAIIDQNNEIKKLNNASYVMHQENIRGTGDIIVYTDVDGIVTIDNGLYTRCEPGDNSWVVGGTTVKLNQEKGRGVAYNAVLRVKNIPIFYSPYISFPINDERATGFLAPTFGTTSNGGFDLSAPYYLNLAPNYDATITPRLLTDRGTLISAEGRYRGKASSNILNISYLADDKLYDSNTAINLANDGPPRSDRWLVDFNHQSTLSSNWSSYVNFSEVSDNDYLQDFNDRGIGTLALSYLTRTAQLNYRGEAWNFRATTDNYYAVSSITSPFNSLPSLNLDGYFENDLGIQYGLNSEYVHYYQDINRSALSAAQLNAGADISGQRLSLEPSISWPWSTPGAFIKPTIKYKYADYQLKNQNQSIAKHQNRGLFMTSIDAGLVFERNIDFFESQYTQTLEPRIYYLNSGFDEQKDIPVFDSADMTFSFSQLFREDRFSGKDRIGDSEQLTFALTSQFLDEKGAQKASASIGQIFYFKDRRVTLYNNPGALQKRSTSSLASQLDYHFNKYWRISSYLEWDPVDNEIDVGNVQFRFQTDADHALNLSYRFRDDYLNPLSNGFDLRTLQTDISAIWPIQGNWGFVGKYNYDHANDRILESIVGVEYDSCCWKIRLVVREWIEENDLFLAKVESDTGIFLQFELKGLGSVLGAGVSDILSDGISGFREHEYAN